MYEAKSNHQVVNSSEVDKFLVKLGIPNDKCPILKPCLKISPCLHEDFRKCDLFLTILSEKIYSRKSRKQKSRRESVRFAVMNNVIFSRIINSSGHKPICDKCGKPIVKGDRYFHSHRVFLTKGNGTSVLVWFRCERCYEKTRDSRSCLLEV